MWFSQTDRAVAAARGLTRQVVSGLFLSGLVAPSAWACGGPMAFDLDAPLVPASSHVERWLSGYDGFEFEPAPVTRFLYALHPNEPGTYAALEEALYGAPLLPGGDVRPAPSLSGFAAAIQAGDRTGAHRAAQRVVEQILDLPVPLAEPYAPLLAEAVEYLEIEPQLGRVSAEELSDYFPSARTSRTRSSAPILVSASEVRGLSPTEGEALLLAQPKHPRAASLRWLRLRANMARHIPDGWDASDIRSKLAEGALSRLHSEADSWLRDYPRHPMAEYVRLKKLRLYYLGGESGPAWALLLDMYPRHPLRVANEMRFLLSQGLEPEGLDLLALPPELASALLPYGNTAEPVWSTLWLRAKDEPDAPWSFPLRERLLWVLATGEPGTRLPIAFPTVASAPSESWSRLRLGALMNTQSWDDAWDQSELMRADTAFVAPIRAQLRLRRGDEVGAITEPGLDLASRSYLMRVLVADESLLALVDHADAEIRFEARLVLALRHREDRRGYQKGARLLDDVDPERAALWREAARLSRRRGPDATLTYARWLRQQAGLVFGGRDYDEIVWYRSLPLDGPPGEVNRHRAPGLPYSLDDEWAGTARWLQSAFATWESLEAYGRWLDRVDVWDEGDDGAQLPHVMAEANEMYNVLLNYGSSEHYAWGTLVRDSEPARVIRRVGREMNVVRD